MSLPPNDPETRKSHSTPGSAENPDETIHPGHSAKSSMETTKAKEITSIILWIVWAIISPAILFLLIRSPVGLAILFLGYMGGGAVILLIFIALLVTGGAIGAKLKGNASGLFFVLIPFVMSFLYMSVYGEFFSFQAKRKSADSRAKAILEKQEAIPIDGLYTESMDLRNALYGMIVVRQFPLVEGDVAGAGWLFDLAQDRQAIHRKSEGKKYFSLSLGPLDSPDCFPWKSESDNLARGASFQPRTCLMVVFDSVLKSDTRLHAKLGQSENSKRYWEISRIGEDTPMVVIPFVADPQYRPHYRYSHESNSFVELMKKLEPRAISLAADGKPYRLKG
ncbi:MAG: hypothetical protein LBS49_05110, partial [Candidatus Accumulibacter sp.]|nr:hypothetical protein [Accumulibacter sp.]